MNDERPRQQIHQYQPEGWRSDEESLSREEQAFTRPRRSHPDPDVRDRSLVLELRGRINYKILRGNKVYIEVGGVVYKTLYGAYWRSVFTGVEHYQLKCEEISGCIWTQGSDATAMVDLPIDYSNDGWTAGGYSLSFMLSRDQT
ncbi:hypothetical protein BH20ACI3_BH20ACI3_30090 [soil metagenome]